ncbi:hypothetical protein DDE82_008533 [Stemphylium lycopersici]|nr:hypothetical protein DDE82_008533 [Stemphylium lycopersici]
MPRNAASNVAIDEPILPAHIPDGPTTVPRSRHAAHQPIGTIPDRLDNIRDYVRGVNSYIHWLQGLTQHERSDVARVTEIKRELKTAHRNLEKLFTERCRGLGGDMEALVKDAMKHAWRSYRNVVKLEEELKGLAIGKALPLREKGAAMNGSDNEKDDEDDEKHIMSGALPVEDKIVDPNQRAGRADALERLRNLPQVPTRGMPSQNKSNLHSSETNPEKVPQPRCEVKRRIQEEEASATPALRDPDRVRRGSCNGFMITEMTMKGLEEAHFVLPYLYHLKIHELRHLKEWLSNEGHIMSWGTISRMEKTLLCIQLLQTGCRYEALAVIHSRSPRQVKESCRQVMQGLLKWHGETIGSEEVEGQAKYLALWGIWDKYVISDGRARLYFGFDWPHLAKVLLALNMYMGRWRMQGRFAMDGPAFVWGKFFVTESAEKVRHMVNGVGSEDDMNDRDGHQVAEPTSFNDVALRHGVLRAKPEG